MTPGEVTSVASSSSDLGQIVSCSDDNTVRIWRLNDQISLCKDGFKCGSADRMTTHTPVLMTSLNLLDNKEHNTTPVRPATRFVLSEYSVLSMVFVLRTVLTLF